MCSIKREIRETKPRQFDSFFSANKRNKRELPKMHIANELLVRKSPIAFDVDFFSGIELDALGMCCA